MRTGRLGRCGTRRNACYRRTVAPTVFASQLVSHSVRIGIILGRGYKLVELQAERAPVGCKGMVSQTWRGAMPTQRSTCLVHFCMAQLSQLTLAMCIRHWVGDLASEKREKHDEAHRRLHLVLVKRRHPFAFCILHSVLRANPSLRFIHRDTCRESHSMYDILVNCHKHKLKSTLLAPRSHEPGSVASRNAEPLMQCSIQANNLSTSHHGAKPLQR